MIKLICDTCGSVITISLVEEGRTTRRRRAERRKESKMKLWLLTQTEQTGYDTFDACVVAAETAEEAVRIHPMTGHDWYEDDEYAWGDSDAWASSPAMVAVQLLGEAVPRTKAGVIITSFNAG